jgi:WS/DGAT/MGAT family acyltransferase
MTRLTATDALFVYADTPKAPMNMGSVQILKLPEGYKGDFYTNFKRFVADRIDYLPKLKMRLNADRIGLPQWVECEDFHLDDHVHRTRVRSEDEAELHRKLGRLQHAPLDRDKPLFMFYVIEGLKDGRIALMQKFHHSFADAATAIQVMNLFTDAGLHKHGKKETEPKPSSWLLTRWLTGSVEDVRRTLKSMPAAVGAVSKMFGEGSREMLSRVQSRPRTIFNESLSEDRLFAIRNWPMQEMTEVRKAAGLTFNDIGLVLFGGALRRYLDELDALPEDSLVCNVPVGLEKKGSKGAKSGNAVLAMWVPMGTNLEDREERVQLIKSEADACKKYLSKVLEGASAGEGIQLPSFLVKPLAMQMGSEWIAKISPPPGNVAMSNAPAPAVPIYIAGADVESLYGLPMVLHGQSLSLTFTSYAGQVVMGILCCEKALPDPDLIFDYMEDELTALKKIYMDPARKKKAEAKRPGKKKIQRRTKKRLKKVASRT